MDRRAFLKGAVFTVAAAPIGTEVPAAVIKSGGMRISVDPDDPGYRQYCVLRGDNKKITVFLNGQKYVGKTADEAMGFVVGPVRTLEGNIAHDGENFLEETLYGDVRIVVS